MPRAIPFFIISLRHKSAALVLVANNNGKLQAFALTKNEKLITAAPHDVYAIIKRKDGGSFKQELYAGSGYLSSSASVIRRSSQLSSITLFNTRGKKREIRLP